MIFIIIINPSNLSGKTDERCLSKFPEESGNRQIRSQTVKERGQGGRKYLATAATVIDRVVSGATTIGCGGGGGGKGVGTGSAGL